MSGEERRRFNRFVVEEMGIGGDILFTTVAKIHDVSLGGACISIERKLTLGREYTFEADYENESIRLKGEVIWEKISGSRKNAQGDVVPVYTVGMKFRDVIGEKGNEIINFICRVTNDPALRLTGVRVQFFAGGKVFLSYPENCFVKRISLGGMLVELEHPLDPDTRFPMEVTFPGDMDPLNFLGRVASCIVAPQTTPARYEIGMEIMEISDICSARLKEFITSLEAIDKGDY